MRCFLRGLVNLQPPQMEQVLVSEASSGFFWAWSICSPNRFCKRWFQTQLLVSAGPGQSAAQTGGNVSSKSEFLTQVLVLQGLVNLQPQQIEQVLGMRDRYCANLDRILQDRMHLLDFINKRLLNMDDPLPSTLVASADAEVAAFDAVTHLQENLTAHVDNFIEMLTYGQAIYTPFQAGAITALSLSIDDQVGASLPASWFVECDLDDADSANRWCHIKQKPMGLTMHKKPLNARLPKLDIDIKTLGTL